MTGIAVKICGTWYPVIHQELWQACRTEDEYFQIMADRQKKGGDYEPLNIEETDEQKQIPGSLF